MNTNDWKNIIKVWWNNLLKLETRIKVIQKYKGGVLVDTEYHCQKREPLGITWEYLYSFAPNLAIAPSMERAKYVIDEFIVETTYKTYTVEYPETEGVQND